MIIIGIIITVIIAAVLSMFIGPFGGIILLAVIFGLVLSTHQKNKKMYDDIQLIKERLGIVVKDEFNMTNEEIEKELEQEDDK